MDKKRIILHIDLDYFFAQAEEKRKPEYAERPLVVCVYTDMERGRGVVSTANYIARKYGVRSGMPIFQAKKLLAGKDAVFVPGDYELYEKTSLGIAGIVSGYGDAFEQTSIDEFTLDISSAGDCKKAEAVAKQIKNKVAGKYGLTCSIGIGPNRLIAKMASDFSKPDGLTVVGPEKVQEFLDPLDVDEIPGIGRKTKEYFAAKGIRTIKDLRETDATLLAEEFGKLMGGWLYSVARGIDESPVGIFEEQKQFSRIKTLRGPTTNAGIIGGEIDELVRDMVNEMQEEEMVCRTVGINAVDINMKAHTRSRTLFHPTRDFDVIKKTAVSLYEELTGELDVPLRRIGVKVEKLESRRGQKKLGEF